jgi:ABC-type lipopolysaccharide export system ATPase subunit
LKKLISSYKRLKHRLIFHVQFFAGQNVTRSCGSLHYVFKDKDWKGIPEMLAEIQITDVAVALCKGEDLCNGSGRRAEISTMMILLPASLLLLISFLLRL